MHLSGVLLAVLLMCGVFTSMPVWAITPAVLRPMTPVAKPSPPMRELSRLGQSQSIAMVKGISQQTYFLPVIKHTQGQIESFTENA